MWLRQRRDPAAAFTSTVLKMYRREAAFFNGLAGDVPVRVPAGYYGAVSDDGADGSLVERVLPRRTSLVRKEAGARTEEQVVAANVDVVLVCAPAHSLNARRIERAHRAECQQTAFTGNVRHGGRELRHTRRDGAGAGTGVERRLRVVLDHQLARLGRRLVDEQGGEAQGHVDAARHAGRRDDALVEVLDDPFVGGHGAERTELVEAAKSLVTVAGSGPLSDPM